MTWPIPVIITLPRDEIAIDAETIDTEQRKILPTYPFAILGKESPCNQSNGARYEDDECSAGPYSPEMHRYNERSDCG